VKPVPYTSYVDPPAPVVTLRVAVPGRGAGMAIVGLVDTGADMTLIPEAVARSLDLPLVSRVGVAGVTGQSESADVHAASFGLLGKHFLAEVVALGNEAIVGRDLLNRFALLLDGPARALQAKPTRSPPRQRRLAPRDRRR
jgi:predicted aspartyl protease